MVGYYKGIEKTKIDQLLYDKSIILIKDILGNDFTMNDLEKYNYIKYIKIKANK